MFIEKPLAISEAQLTLLEPLLEQGKLFVDFNRRFAPTTVALIAHFSSRRDPLAIHYRVNAGIVPADSWVRDLAVGGGRLVGEACHFVDFCSAVVGARLATIAAAGLGEGPRTLDGDNVVLTLHYEDGLSPHSPTSLRDRRR